MSMLLFAAVLGAPFASAGEREPYQWPDGRRAAVSLAYDDALDSQLDNAIPALERHGFRASFYLPLSADTLRTRLPEWRAAAARGHELGNHTLFHQCSGAGEGRGWVEPQRDLDTTTAAQMADQVRLANAMLGAIDGRTARTLAVPCGDAVADGVNYVELVEQEFVAIRLGNGAVVEDMATLDPHALSVDTPAQVTGTQLIAIVEAAARKGTMANLTFHGVGGDYLAVSSEAHETLLDHLARHPEVYWVAPFVEIMQYVRQQNGIDDSAGQQDLKQVP
ncbi:polysaccharide deacetylase family protein [Lysobacter sp. F6437]|uniref:polysaccharide deacetylase family protein n=1 Tax=Lysobacter sp. F6437 TaxID=3459296 RepID=UPI00403D8B61